MRDDDDGQVDGEGFSPRSPFATSMQGAPWLSGNPPWTMWGDQKIIDIPPGLFEAGLVFSTTQIARINYKRPDTWRFLFEARLLSGGTGSVAPDACTVFVNFDLIVGVGRSSTPLESFCEFTWSWSGTNPPPIAERRWSTFGQRPPRTSAGAAAYEIEQLVSQDIQCQVRCAGAVNYTPTVPIRVAVNAFFAPNVHVRPDWLQLDVPREAQFAGDETQGT